MNSETDRPTPPRRFNKRRKETSVTPAIGDSTSGGLISISRILKGLISVIRWICHKKHERLKTSRIYFCAFLCHKFSNATPAYGFFDFLSSFLSLSLLLAAAGDWIFRSGSTLAR